MLEKVRKSMDAARCGMPVYAAGYAAGDGVFLFKAIAWLRNRKFRETAAAYSISNATY
jgi:hypothetical protein